MTPKQEQLLLARFKLHLAGAYDDGFEAALKLIEDGYSVEMLRAAIADPARGFVTLVECMPPVGGDSE